MRVMGGHGRDRRSVVWVQVAVIVMATWGLGGTALADGFTVTGKLGGNFEYDTNPLLLKKGNKSLIGWNSTPQLILTGRTPDLTLDSTTILNDGRFNQSNFNSTDVHNYSSIYYSGEKSYAKLQTGFDYDTTRTSELDSSGVNIAGIRHTGFSIAPEFGYNITPVQKVVLAMNYAASFYDDTSRFTNYQNFGISPKYLYSFTMRDTGFIALQASHFNTLSGSSSTGDSAGPQVGWIHHFSDKFTTSADVGYHIIHDKSSDDGSTWDSDYFYDFSLTYGEPGDPDIASISVGRSLQPQSSAQQVTQTTIGVKETHHFTPRFAAIVSGSYHNKSYALQEDGHQKDYLEGSAALQYNVTQELVAGATYRYRQQTTTGDSTTASSQSVLLTLTYSPNASLVSW